MAVPKRTGRGSGIDIGRGSAAHAPTLTHSLIHSFTLTHSFSLSRPLLLPLPGSRTHTNPLSLALSLSGEMEELCILLNRLASVVIVNAKKLSLLSCLEGNVGAHLTTAARQVSIAVNELGRNIEQSDELNADSAASSAGAGAAAEDRTSKTKRLIMASNRQLKLLVLELLRLLKRCIINPYDDAVRRELKEQADSICSLACGILSSLHVLLASSLEESQLLNLCALISCDIALLVDATTVVNDQRLRQDAEIELETSVQDLSGFLPTPVIETIVTLQNELIDTARRVGAAAASPDALQSVVTAFEARLSSFASGSPAPAASPNNNNNNSNSSSSSNTATSPNSGNASPLTTSGSSKLSSKKRSEGSLQLSSSASSASSSSSSSGFSSAPGPAGTGSLTKTMSSDKNPSSPATPKRSASSRGPSSSADADNEDNSDGKVPRAPSLPTLRTTTTAAAVEVRDPCRLLYSHTCGRARSCSVDRRDDDR